MCCVMSLAEVRILGGEVGTAAGVADGFGNVFGGGNVGYVYSGTGQKSAADGYYYHGSELTEDCSVVITPWCQAKSDITIPNGGGTYQAGQFVPASDLDRLQNKSSAHSTYWDKLDLSGVIVHNAIFAGGNVTVGDAGIYANEKTVHGNVSANVVDIYNRDLVTIGAEHVGGIYGDGNLTLVDGYRELNITNYGTDYYGMSDNISLEDYYKLTDRERAYFALEYQCINAYEATSASGTKSYAKGQRITEEVYNALDDQYKGNWQLWGFCSIYAGRLMNTIQRADFCGIFGSRLVMQGAKDRVPSVADKTDYTVKDDLKGIVVQRMACKIKSERELWFMASEGYSPEQCAAEWGVKYSTFRDYLSSRYGGEEHVLPERLKEYQRRFRAARAAGNIPKLSEAAEERMRSRRRKVSERCPSETVLETAETVSERVGVGKGSETSQNPAETSVGKDGVE